MVVTDQRPQRAGLGRDLRRAARQLAAVSVPAAILGVVVGGVGGRVAMALLFATNQETKGAVSDDGFTIGQFTLSGTMNLLGTGVQLGLTAAVCYLALRGLLIGPRWFQVASMAVGAGVVVAAIIVAPDGIDFTAFDPPLLPVGMFILLPVLYVALLALVAERCLADDSWFATADLRIVLVLGGLCWLAGGLIVIVLPIVAAVWLAWRWFTQRGVVERLNWPAVGWVFRGFLGALFALAVSNLLSDVQAIT